MNRAIRTIYLLVALALIGAACGGSPTTGADGADADDRTASPAPSPTPPAPAEALLDGDWDVVITVEQAVNLRDRKKGQVFERRWTFDPQCSEGPCDVRAIRETSDGTYRHEFEYRDGAYSSVLHEEGDCRGDPVPATYEWELQVVDADLIEEVWRATRIEGTVDVRYEPTPEQKAAGCASASERDRFEGERVSP